MDAWFAASIAEDRSARAELRLKRPHPIDADTNPHSTMNGGREDDEMPTRALPADA